MSRQVQVGRRQFLKYGGYALGVPVASMLPFSGGLAQVAQPMSDPFRDWRELGDISSLAIALGVPVPRMSAQLDTREGQDYSQIMPAAVELIESLEASRPVGGQVSSDVEALLERTDTLLRRVHQGERNLPDEREEGTSLSTRRLKPDFESVKGEYRSLFEASTVRGRNKSTLRWYTSKLLTKSNQDRWHQVAQEACCPWYFVAIIHAMEAGFNFRSHLHNGDSLRRKTRQVPRNRPPVWSPPNDWQSSAVDALRYDGFGDVSDWTLEKTLYRWEGYNGWRSRRNGINTPYLWSFSNQYAKGKFVADNVWDPNAVSKQCGAAVMLKDLVDGGFVKLPT